MPPYDDVAAQLHTTHPAPEPGETPAVPLTPLPLADGQDPVSKEAPGVKPEDAVTVLGKSQEIVGGISSLPQTDELQHMAIERPAKKHLSPTPSSNALPTVSSLDDLMTEVGMEAEIDGRVRRSDGGTSLPSSKKVVQTAASNPYTQAEINGPTAPAPPIREDAVAAAQGVLPAAQSTHVANVNYAAPPPTANTPAPANGSRPADAPSAPSAPAEANASVENATAANRRSGAKASAAANATAAGADVPTPNSSQADASPAADARVAAGSSGPAISSGSANAPGPPNAPVAANVSTENTLAPNVPAPNSSAAGNSKAAADAQVAAQVPPYAAVSANVSATANAPAVHSSAAASGVAQCRHSVLDDYYKTMRRLSPAAEAKLEVVPRMSVEYVQVMLKLGSMDVDSVRMLRNEAVDMAFAVAVSGVKGEYELVKVLHGTTVSAVDAIVREGFKVGGEEVRVRNGSAKGKGVYLTTNVETAAAYSRGRIPNCQYMMLCELCVDQKCIKSNRGVYVQPDKALVKPLYVVEFKRPPLHKKKNGNRDKKDYDENCNCANCLMVRYNAQSEGNGKQKH